MIDELPDRSEWVLALRESTLEESEPIIEATKGYLKPDSMEWIRSEQERLMLLVGYYEAARNSTMREFYANMISNVKLSIRHELDASRLNAEWDALEAKSAIIEALVRGMKSFTKRALELAVEYGFKTLKSTL